MIYLNVSKCNFILFLNYVIVILPIIIIIMDLKFRESQGFNQSWIWLVLSAISILLFFALYNQFIGGYDEVYFDRSELIISSFIVLSVVLMFAFVKLKTSVDSKGIKVSMIPFVSKSYAWSEVDNACVLKYNSVNGVGIRLFTKYGRVYRMKGNRGVFVELKNGNKFLIGTQKEEELAKVIEFLQ